MRSTALLLMAARIPNHEVDVGVAPWILWLGLAVASGCTPSADIHDREEKQVQTSPAVDHTNCNRTQTALLLGADCGETPAAATALAMLESKIYTRVYLNDSECDVPGFYAAAAKFISFTGQHQLTKYLNDGSINFRFANQDAADLDVGDLGVIDVYVIAPYPQQFPGSATQNQVRTQGDPLSATVTGFVTNTLVFPRSRAFVFTDTPGERKTAQFKRLLRPHNISVPTSREIKSAALVLSLGADVSFVLKFSPYPDKPAFNIYSGFFGTDPVWFVEAIKGDG